MNPFEDAGGIGKARFPVKLRRYSADSLPEPGRHVDCVIAVNDAASPDRPRLAFSDGSQWHRVFYCDETPAAQPVAAPAPAPVVVAQPVQDSAAVDQVRSDQAAMAATMTEMAHVINDLQRRVVELERTSIREGDVVDRRKLLGEAA